MVLDIWMLIYPDSDTFTPHCILCVSHLCLLTELTLLAGLGEVLSSGPSALLGIFRPPYFFQYIQQETHRRHCMFGGPHEYHWADCMAVNTRNALRLVRGIQGENWFQDTQHIDLFSTASSLSLHYFINIHMHEGVTADAFYWLMRLVPMVTTQTWSWLNNSVSYQILTPVFSKLFQKEMKPQKSVTTCHQQSFVINS